MEPRISAGTAALKAASTMRCSNTVGAPARVIESVVIGEDPAVGDVGIVVEDDAVMMPVVSPVVPTPAKAAKEADAKAKSPCKSGPCKVQAWIPIPPWPDPNRISIHEPWIVFG